MLNNRTELVSVHSTYINPWERSNKNLFTIERVTRSTK